MKGDDVGKNLGVRSHVGDYILRKISAVQWIAWIAATATAALTMAAYAFTTFETKEHTIEVKTDIVARLQRIEAKIDSLR